MAGLTVALYGTNGHQISGLVATLGRARLVGVADVPAERVAEWKEAMPEAYAGAERYEGLAELLERAAPELVSICSARRDRQHEDIVRALEAGAHVYAEKPLATTLEGLEAIRRAAERTGREVRAMTGMRYAPGFREMQALVASGRLGDVVQVFAQKSYPYHDRRPQDTGVDGGLIPQASIHAVDYVRFVTGLEFEQIAAMDTRRGNPADGGLRIATPRKPPGGCQPPGGSRAMTGGALCSIVCNYCNPPGIGFWGNDQLRVHGTGGMAEVTDCGDRSLVAIGEREPTALEDPSLEGGYEFLLKDYVDHLLDGSPMLLTQDDCFTDTEVVIRAQQSADSGRAA